MGGLSVWKLLLILLVVILIFGARRLPELGKGLGTGIVNFRKALKSDEAIEEDDDSPQKNKTENAA